MPAHLARDELLPAFVYFIFPRSTRATAAATAAATATAAEASGAKLDLNGRRLLREPLELCCHEPLLPALANQFAPDR